MRKSSLALGALLLISIVVIVSAGLTMTSNIICVRANGVEVCNTVDDDGDNYIDEYDDPYFGGPRYVDQSCYGIGECGLGFVECKPGTNEVDCDTNPGGTSDKSEMETCNTLDDDCDGAIDEDFTYQDPVWGERLIDQSCNGIGECGMGFVECSQIYDEATCSTNPDGSEPGDITEICNTLDDDCDGETDEGGVCFLSITLSNNPVIFPNMNPGTTIDANTGNGFPLTLTIDSETTVSDISVSIKADNSYFAGPGTLAISNMKWSYAAAGTYTGYTTSDATVCTGLFADETCDIYHQLSVPSGQVPGDYSIGITITATSPMG